MATSCAVNNSSREIAERLSSLTNKRISTEIASKLIERAIKNKELKEENVTPENITPVLLCLTNMVTNGSGVDDLSVDKKYVSEALGDALRDSLKKEGEKESAGQKPATGKEVSLSDHIDAKTKDAFKYSKSNPLFWSEIIDLRKEIIEDKTKEEYANDLSTFFDTSKIETKNIAEPAKTRGTLAEAFDYDYAKVNQFGRSMAIYFREACEQIAIPECVSMMESQSASIRKALDSGFDKFGSPVSQDAVKPMRDELKELGEKLKVLNEEGWLGAAKVPEAMNIAAKITIDGLRNARSISHYIHLKRKQLGTNDVKTLVKAAQEHFSLDFDLSENMLMCIIRADQRVPFLDKLLNGYDRKTDAELLREAEEKGDKKTLAEMDSRDAKELETVRAYDNETLAERRKSDMRMRQLLERIALELTKTTGVRFTLSKEKSGKEKDEKDEDDSDETDDNTEEDGTEEDGTEEGDESEAGNQNENDPSDVYAGRDIQFIQPFQRSVQGTVSAKVKRVLSSLTEYVYDKADGQFYAQVDPMFNMPRPLPSSVAFAQLLETLNDAENGKGLWSGDLMYQFLKHHEKEVGWYHGIVEEMDRDPSLKTAFFVTFYKRRMPMRSFQKKSDVFKNIDRKENEDDKLRNSAEWQSTVTNYDNDDTSIVVSIKENTYNGVVLNTGHEATTAPVQLGSFLTRRYMAEIELHDISVYGTDGRWQMGKLSVTPPEKEFDKYGRIIFDRNKSVKGVATGAYAFAILLNDIIERSVYQNDTYAKFKARDARNAQYLTLALRAVGVNVSPADLDAAFSQYPKRFLHCIWALRNLQQMGDYHEPELDTSDHKVMSKYEDLSQGAFFDHCKNWYGILGRSLAGLNRNTVEASFRWNGKQYYSYGNRSYVTELVSQLGDHEEDYYVANYLEENFLRRNAYDASFFTEGYENVRKRPILNGILRDVMPSEDPKENMAARIMRAVFRFGYDNNLGIGKVEYDKMTVAQKLSVELANFYNPQGGKNRSLARVIEDYCSNYHLSGPSVWKGQSYSGETYSEDNSCGASGLAKYSLPIMADSGSHIFVGSKAFYHTDSREEDGLLYRCADSIIAESQRIRIFKSNTVNGKPLKRTAMPKTFSKNLLKYNYFPQLNEMSVITEDGRDMDFATAMSEIDNYEGQRVIIKIGDEAHHVTLQNNMDSLHRELAMEAADIALAKMFKSDMDYWESAGVFDIKPDGSDFSGLVSTDNVLIDAFEQYHRRKESVDRLLYGHDKNGERNISRECEGRLKEAGVYDFLVEYGKPRFGENVVCDKGEGQQEAIKAIQDKAETVRSILKEFSTDKDDAYAKAAGSLSSLFDGRAGLNYNDYLKGIGNLKPDDTGINLLVEAMRRYARNRTCFKSQMISLLVGDVSQFKGEDDLSKRTKAITAMYEHCDLSAVDVRNGGRQCLDYYGENKVDDWDVRYQKAITLKDFQAKGNEDNTISGFHGLSQFFNEQLLPKLKHDLKAGLISAQEYADRCSAYAEMNVSDGQSFRTMESMKKMLDMLGLSTDETEKVYRAVVIEKRKLRWDEIHDFYLQMKTVSYGFQEVRISYGQKSNLANNAKESTRVYVQKLADFIKDSQLTLMLYSEDFSSYLGKDSVMEGVLRFASKNQVDVIHFDSAKKTGETNEVDILSARNGTEAERMLQEAFDYGADHKEHDIRHREAWSNVGRQIPVPEHLVDKTIGRGTQLDKIIQSDIPETWTYADENGNKKTAATRIKVRNDDGSVAASLSPKEFRDLQDRLKIANMRDRLKKLEQTIGDKEKLSKMLIASIDTSNKYADNIREALEIDPNTGDFKIPVDNQIVVRAVQSIIASAVRKQVVKQKTCGGTGVQFSSVGRSEALKTVWGIDEETGQPYIKYCEAMLPAWAKGLFMAYAKPDGTLDVNDIPIEVRTMVGYRVPTEGPYSMIPMRIVGFLNEEGGSSVMLPQEIVVWSGSDFDIDKLFIEIPEFKVTPSHLTKSPEEAWISYYQARPELTSKLRGLWADEIKKDIDGRLTTTKRKRDALKSLLADLSIDSEPFAEYRRDWSRRRKEVGGRGELFAVLDKDGRLEVQKDYDAFLDESGIRAKTEIDLKNSLHANCTQEDIDNADETTRNNLLIKLDYARLTSDFALMNFFRPGGFRQQKKMARIMTILSNNKEGYTYEELSQLPMEDTEMSDGRVIKGLDSLAGDYKTKIDIMQASSDDQLFERNMVGSHLIGIYALHNAFHAVIQKAPITLSDEFLNKYNFSLNGRGMRQTVGDIYDEDGGNITMNIAGFLAASVDNAKDPVLADLTQNQDTADLSTAMLHLGYSTATTTLLISQPIVKSLLREFRADPYNYNFNALIQKKYKQFNIEKDNRLDLNIDTLAANMSKTVSDSGYMLARDPVSRSVLHILNAMTYVSSAIRGAMDATKITSPSSNMGNSIGLTVNRVRPIKDLRVTNTIKEDVADEHGKVQESIIKIFKPDDYEFLVVHKHDDGGSEPMPVDEYINGSSRLGYVQACYDFGMDRALRGFSKFSSLYGKTTQNAIDILDSWRLRDDVRIKTETINKLAEELRLYRTITSLVSDEINAGHSLEETRRAFLDSFPQYFTDVIKAYYTKGSIIPGKKGPARDLREEFSILRHILIKRQGGKLKGLNVLRMSDYKSSKDQLNEYVTSWDKMMNDPDPVIKDLAIRMFKYSMFYNGCGLGENGFGQFAPISVMEYFKDYNDTVKALSSNTMAAEDMDRFLDQFVRNHIKDFTNKVIYKLDSSDLDEIKTIAYEKTRVPYTTDDGRDIMKDSYKPKESFIYTFDGELGKAKYIMTTINRKNYKALYRRVGGESNPRYELCGALGDKGFLEYDPSQDLRDANKLGGDRYRGEVNDMPVEQLFQIKGIVIPEQVTASNTVHRQKEILDDLTASLAHVNYKDKSDGAGNDSSAYLVGPEQKEAERVHAWMAELGFGEIKKPERYTEEQWETAKSIGRTLGSAIDNFARLYIKERTVGLSDSERNEIHSIFAENGPLSDMNISIGLSEGRGMESQLRYVLDRAIIAMCKTLNDKVFTQLGGKNIVVWGDVETKLGRRTIGGELDLLIAHADGSFTIADLKQIKSSLLNRILQDVGVPMPGGTYAQYCTQLNCYRSLLLNRYPDMVINRLCIVPIVTERSVIHSDGTPSESSVPDLKRGEGVVVTKIDNMKLKTNDGIERNLIDVPQDATMSGINGPAKTQTQADKEVAVLKAANDAEETQTLPSDGFATAREIFVKYIGEEKTSEIDNMIRKLDGIFTESELRDFQEDGETPEKHVQFAYETLFKPRKRRPEMEDIAGEWAPGRFPLETWLLGLNVEQNIINTLADAIRRHKKIIDDSGVRIC